MLCSITPETFLAFIGCKYSNTFSRNFLYYKINKNKISGTNTFVEISETLCKILQTTRKLFMIDNAFI